MDTLLETITYVKGIEYLIAVAFLLGFIAFWLLITIKGKRRWIPVSVLAYMFIGFVILLGSCVSTTPR